MKGKYLALPLAVLLILSACGQDDDIKDANVNEIQDPLLQDSGENDIGT